jgi:hypothetical protein
MRKLLRQRARKRETPSPAIPDSHGAEHERAGEQCILCHLGFVQTVLAESEEQNPNGDCPRHTLHGILVSVGSVPHRDLAVADESHHGDNLMIANRDSISPNAST